MQAQAGSGLSLSFQAVQEGLTALHDVVVGHVKIAGVPGVRDVTGAGTVVQQAADLMIRVAPGDAGHVPHVGAVSGQEQVVSVVVGAGHLHRPVVAKGHAHLLQLAFGRGIDRVADLLPAGGGGIRHAGDPPRRRPLGKNILRHGTAADVAVAHEK